MDLLPELCSEWFSVLDRWNHCTLQGIGRDTWRIRNLHNIFDPLPRSDLNSLSILCSNCGLWLRRYFLSNQPKMVRIRQCFRRSWHSSLLDFCSEVPHERNRVHKTKIRGQDWQNHQVWHVRYSSRLHSIPHSRSVYHLLALSCVQTYSYVRWRWVSKRIRLVQQLTIQRLGSKLRDALLQPNLHHNDYLLLPVRFYDCSRRLSNLSVHINNSRPFQ